MSWNGSGVFNRIYNWVADRDANIDITASRFDAENDDFASGIQACLAKNGENSPTADLPMNSKKHTDVDDATARNQYSAVGQVQDGEFNYATDTGAADAYAISPTPVITAYVAGQEFSYIATNASTGSSTLSVSGLPAKAQKKNGNADDTVANDIKTNDLITVKYDGTVFQITDKKRLSPGEVDTTELSDNAVTEDKLATALVHLAKVGVEGSAVASASTIDLDAATGEFVHITGTTTITAITLAQGIERTVVFDGILTLSNGAGLILKSGANITTAAGDTATFRGEGSSVTRCTGYDRADGKALVTSAPFSDSYTSTEITISAAGNVTPSHGLSSQPTLVQARVVCKTAEYNYSIGDEVVINPTGMAQASADGRGLVIVPTASTLYIQFASSSQPIEILNKTTGVPEFITNANWKLVVRAWV